MLRSIVIALSGVAFSVVSPATRQSATQTELVPLQWLEPVADAPKGKLPVLRPIAAGDPRVDQASRLVENEAARFIRSAIAAAWRMTPEHRTGDLPPLPILFQRGGNNARQGFQLVEGASRKDLPDVPYVVLELDADRLSLTLLHEGGHVVDRIVRSRGRAEATWSAVPHSTFAVTDPVTALSEGFATHFETLWGHYGSTPERRAYYHRTDPQWAASPPIRGELVAPVRDVMTFSQNWARYQAVRDGLPVFEGHVYPGDYLRSQFDPARDRARLRTGSALVASEGTVASVLFWVAQGRAAAAGVREGGGLDQPGLLEAELAVMTALHRARSTTGTPVDLVDVVSATGDNGSPERRSAVERLVAITKGATARGDLRSRWRELYEAAIGLDITRARALVGEIDGVRKDIVERGLRDPGALRQAVGRLLPVRLEKVPVQLKALGEPFPVEMDLNALGSAELHVLSKEADVRSAIERTLGEKPFNSYEDFELRTGIRLAGLGATPVK